MKNYKNAVFRDGDKVGKDYVCGTCGAGNRRLWRDSHTTLAALDLYCAPCAERAEAENIKKYAEHKHPDENIVEHSIGNLLPARPTPEGDNFWGHSSGDGHWWYWLPQYPDDPAREFSIVRRERNMFVRESDQMGERWVKESREHNICRRERDEAYRIAEMRKLPLPMTYAVPLKSGTKLKPADIVVRDVSDDVRFATTAYVVDASDTEQHDIWWRWVHLHGLRYEQDSMGMGLEIGRVDNRPIFVTVSWGVFAGMFRVAFVDGTSQLVDYKLIEEWEKRVFPCLSAFGNHTNAMNFGNVLADMRRRLGSLPLRDSMAVEQAAHKVALKP